MSGLQLILSFIVVTFGWRMIAKALGPVLAKKFYANKVAAVQAAGTRFENQAAMQAWAEQASASSVNMALLLIAAGVGAVAGAFNFPLIGFSRSMNGWSWLRVITLCGVSWLVALAMYSSNY